MAALRMSLRADSHSAISASRLKPPPNSSSRDASSRFEQHQRLRQLAPGRVSLAGAARQQAQMQPRHGEFRIEVGRDPVVLAGAVAVRRLLAAERQHVVRPGVELVDRAAAAGRRPPRRRPARCGRAASPPAAARRDRARPPAVPRAHGRAPRRNAPGAADRRPAPHPRAAAPRGRRAVGAAAPGPAPRPARSPCRSCRTTRRSRRAAGVAAASGLGAGSAGCAQAPRVASPCARSRRCRGCGADGTASEMPRSVSACPRNRKPPGASDCAIRAIAARICSGAKYMRTLRQKIAS